MQTVSWVSIVFFAFFRFTFKKAVLFSLLCLHTIDRGHWTVVPVTLGSAQLEMHLAVELCLGGKAEYAACCLFGSLVASISCHAA